MNKFIQLTAYEDNLPFCINVEQVNLFTPVYSLEGSPTLILTREGGIPVKEPFYQVKALIKIATASTTPPPE